MSGPLLFSMILTRVIYTPPYTPAIGIVTDTDSMVTVVVHRCGDSWQPVGAVMPGESDAKTLPESFAIPGDIEADLDKRLRAARV